MKDLSYFDLLSPCPILIKDVGRIKSPLLRDIAKLGYESYETYLNMLAANLPSHLEAAGFSMMDLIGANPTLKNLYLNIFSFFICGEVSFHPNQNAFLITENKKPVGSIHQGNFSLLIRHLLQINYIHIAPKEEEKYANEKAREIADRIKREKEKQQSKKKGNDHSISLANMISSLAAFHHSLNMENIWNLTVYQLHDQFFKQNHKQQLDIHAMNYAYFGGEFSPSDWFKNLLDK